MNMARPMADRPDSPYSNKSPKPDVTELLSFADRAGRDNRLRVGEFRIFRSPFMKKICIYNDSGEGGHFPVEKVEAAVAQFFKDNF